MRGLEIFLADLIEQMPLIWLGIGQTLKLTVLISITGLLLGIVVFYLRQSQLTVIRRITQAYISFFVGMPLIVLLFLMYYGLPHWGISMSPFTVALIGFTLNVAAYNAGYLMSAYGGVDATEVEAARAQGFSNVQVFRLVTLPQVLRLSLPSLTNQIILNLKDSSVAFLVQYTEFFARVQELTATNFQLFYGYAFAALVYLLFVSVIVIAARQLEKRIHLQTLN